MQLHIFSASAILNRIEKNKHEKNLYQHINNTLKGSKQGNPKIIGEMIDIIEKETRDTLIILRAIKTEIEKIQEPGG